jgi:hypothetical protein
MAKNFVENHIQAGAFHTFKVNAGSVIKIGQLVKVVGNRTVAPTSATGDIAIGVVYSGTVGIDGINDGYVGDNGDVVTVVILKPFVYLEAGGAITAGALVKGTAGGKAIVATADATDLKAVVGISLEAKSSGERFLAVLV